MQSINSRAFGRALKKTRRRAHMTQEGLAEAADLSRVYISLLERGLRSPTFDTVMALCTAMSIDLTEFCALVLNELHSIRARPRPN